MPNVKAKTKQRRPPADFRNPAWPNICTRYYPNSYKDLVYKVMQDLNHQQSHPPAGLQVRPFEPSFDMGHFG